MAKAKSQKKTRLEIINALYTLGQITIQANMYADENNSILITSYKNFAKFKKALKLNAKIK